MLIIPMIILNSGIETGAVVSFSPLIYIGAIMFSLLTAWLGAIAPARKAASRGADIYNLKSSCIENNVTMASRYEGRKSMQDTKMIMLVLGGGISLILGFIGIFNFINVMSVGVISQKIEFATLESIGMGRKQLRTMLRYEGIGHAAITLLFSVTFGNIFGYMAFIIFKRGGRIRYF